MTRQSADPTDQARRRDVWITVPCVKCGARVGSRCIRKNGGKRFSSHIERWNSYREYVAYTESLVSPK